MKPGLYRYQGVGTGASAREIAGGWGLLGVLALRERPVLIGYQMVRVGTEPEVVREGWELLVRFAAREGYVLGGVFVERDRDRPYSALRDLIAYVKEREIAAVVVPTERDLGLLERVREATRRRVERESGVRVVIASSQEQKGLIRMAGSDAIAGCGDREQGRDG
jgi:hypothetical protein